MSIVKNNIICPNCQFQFNSKLKDLVIAFGCPSCFHCYKRLNSEWVLSFKFNAPKKSFYLPLGAEGKIDGESYCLISQVVKKDTEGFEWREYTLIDKKGKLIYLSEYNGHWIKIKDLPEDLNFNFNQSNIKFSNKEYAKYTRYKFKSRIGLGEFNANVFSDSSSETVEFIAPPDMVGLEKSANKMTYFIGEHIDAEEVQNIFKVNQPFPLKIGRGMLELSKIDKRFYDSLYISISAAVLLIILFFSNFLTIANKVVFESKYGVDLEKAIHVSPIIDLTHGTKNMEITLSSVLDNNWLGTQVDFINIETGEIISVYGEIEHYKGYTDGEHWSEGSNTGSFLVSSIPEGKYRFEVSFQSGKFDYFFVNFTMKRNVPTPRNLLICLFLLAVYPSILYYFKYNFEVGRWKNSGYSPYNND